MGEGPFDTWLLDAAWARQREVLEQERCRVVEDVRRLLDRWGPAYGIRRAYLFGSVGD